MTSPNMEMAVMILFRHFDRIVICIGLSSDCLRCSLLPSLDRGRAIPSVTCNLIIASIEEFAVVFDKIAVVCIVGHSSVAGSDTCVVIAVVNEANVVLDVVCIILEGCIMRDRAPSIILMISP